MEILTSVKRLYISFKSLVNDFVYSFVRAALLLLVEVQNHTVPVRERGRIRVKPFVTISVALIITGITIHCKVHIRCISIHNPFTLVSFCFLLRDISVCTYCHICQYACILLLLLLWGKQNIYCYEDAQAVPSRPSSKGTRKQGKAFGVEI